MTWQPIDISVSIYLVVVGLMVGSFVNLAGDRLPRGESVVSPRSHCRNCGRTLNVIDLLPVAGYLLRRGRCAGCGTAVGRAAPLVEAVCGLLVAVPLILLGLWPGAAVGLILLVAFGTGVVSLAMIRTAAAAASGGDVNL